MSQMRKVYSIRFLNHFKFLATCLGLSMHRISSLHRNMLLKIDIFQYTDINLFT